ncbi:MAG: hypothetical protein CMJ51_02300 [Planctomycetaceae bacterium]|nr:hypothetical protein [Planctomycetaceae bacterium]
MSDDSTQGPEEEFSGVAEESAELEAPRREKSADFELRDGDEGDQMLDAMDPANQSLGEALKLSYRVLQVAILGLAVVFLFSGFQTVGENSTGVRTLFGKIVGEGDDGQIGAGLQPFWPYPVGEIITVPMKRTIEVNSAFFPNLRKSNQLGVQDQSLEQATSFAAVDVAIKPGREGSLLLRGGDIGHCRMTAEYSIDDAVSFLERFTAAQADEVVKMAIERATVHTAAVLTLTQFVDDRDGVSRDIRSQAQATLDSVDSGIRISSINVTDRIPPLAVRKSVQRVTASRENAKTAVAMARTERTTILDAAVGAAAFDEIVSLIGDYETEIERGNPAAADAVLARIGERFEQDDIGGDAATTLTRARASRSMIDSGLGTFARRVGSLSESYRQNPRQLVRQLWLDAYQEVLSGPEVEVISAPPGLGGLALKMKSSTDVSNARRDGALNRRTMEAMQGTDFSGYQLGSRQISIDRAGRRLERDASGGFGRQETGE